MMRTDVEGIEVGACGSEPVLEPYVNARERVSRHIATGDGGLVGNHDGKATGVINSSDGVARSFEQLHLFDGTQIVDIPVERPITVEEHRRAERPPGQPIGHTRRDVPLHLVEPLRGSDVLDIFRRDVSVESTAREQHGRQHLPAEIAGDVGRCRAFKSASFDHEQGRAREIVAFFCMWVRVQRADESILRQCDEIGIERVVVRMREQRGVGAPLDMDVPHSSKIDVQIGVTEQHQKSVEELRQCIVQRSGGAARRLLDGVPKRHAVSRPVSKMCADHLVSVMHEQENPAEPVTATERNLVLEQRRYRAQVPLASAMGRCAS